MNEFSNLVKFRNELVEDIAKLEALSFIDRPTEILNSLKKRNPTVSWSSLSNDYIKKYQQLAVENDNIINQLRQEANFITEKIDNLANELFNTTEQNDLFKKQHVYQLLPVEEEQTNIILTRIGDYCDFRYPGLVMYPRERKWLTSAVVACDPLYIYHDKFISIDEFVNEFSELYQSRIRRYPENFSKLPVNQFGFILFWDYLNYISFNHYDQYFSQIYSLLRPGGTAMISYNDCDIYDLAVRAEMKSSAYATKHMITKLAFETGFEITSFETLHQPLSSVPYVTWVELRKPGELKPIKAHQALAKIVSK